MDPVTEIVPGIYQLHVPLPDNPLGFTLPYLLTGSEGHILIDTGIPSPVARQALIEQLRSLIDPREILIIAITHSHLDHSGLVGEVKKLAPEAKVAIHEKDWNEARSWGHPGGRDGDGTLEEMASWAISHGFPTEESDEVARWIRERREARHGYGDGHEEMRPMAQPDLLLEGGKRLSNGTFSLETIHTPGHSPGHLCYYEPTKKVMFTGDHVLPVITSNVSIRPGSAASPLEDYLASLSKVAQWEVEVVCPAHEYVFHDLQGRVAELHRHHEARLEGVLRALGDEARTTYEVAQGVPWDVGSWEEMKPWLHRAAMGETLAHLELLINQGQVFRSQDGGPVRFETVRA